MHQSHAGANCWSLLPNGQDRFPLSLLGRKSEDFTLAFSEKEGLEGGLHPLGPRLCAPLRPGPADVPEGRCEGLGALLETTVHKVETVF